MPNKYSHTVVLAHYSSLGLIDLPNDQYIAYLKTYPTSRPPSHNPRHKGPSSATQGSITPSTSYRSRYRISDEPASSRSVTGHREYGTSITRNAIQESDEGEEEEERVILHKKTEPDTPPLQSRKKVDGQHARTEKRKARSDSTYTGRSSSETSDRIFPSQTQQHASAQANNKPKTPSPSVINLNDYEAEPVLRGRGSAPARHTEPRTAPSLGLSADPIAAQTKAVNRTVASLPTQENRIASPGIQNEPDFDGFSDSHNSELTVTGVDKGRSDSLLTVPTRQFPQSTLSTKPILSSTDHPPTLPKRVDSAPGFHISAPKQRHLQHHRSCESSSSADSEHMMHETTTPRDAASSRPQKALRTKPGKINLASRDPKVTEDAIDPSFFEQSGRAPRQASTSPTGQRLAALHSNPPPSASRPSHQYSRRSSDHAPPNPDFWRGLEEMLSDSDASVAFPPDIAKYKPRDGNVLPAAKADKSPRSGTDDGELKRPTTAPAPMTSGRDALGKDEPLPDGRSRITVTDSARLDKPKANRELTTVQLVDTSPQKKAKKFLRKLRKKTYDVKNA